MMKLFAALVFFGGLWLFFREAAVLILIAVVMLIFMA